MSWAVSALGARRGTRPRRVRHAFTLIEVLVATGLTLLLMSTVAGIFVLVSNNISDARATIEMSESLRATQFTLQNDLAGLTARGAPPLDPANGLGYLEIIEGPVGPCGPADTVPVVYGAPPEFSSEVGKPLPTQSDIDEANNKGLLFGSDTTVGDNDDILQFTTRSEDTPFTGRGPILRPGGGIQLVETQSNVAEVSWFLRGRTLYRRVLLVDPTYDASIFTNNGVWGDANHSYYEMSDVSVRQTGGQYDPQAFPDTSQPVGYPRLVANSLGDLTKRENRYGHPPLIMSPAGLTTNWPHDARMWGALRLPTLRECSDPRWPLPFYAWLPANSTNFDSYGVPGESSVHTSAGVVLPRGVPVHRNKNLFDRQPVVRFPTNDNSRPRLKFDPWLEPRQWEGIDPATGGLTSGTGAPGQAQPPLIYNGSRFSDDVILTNVVSFDVKVWDPGAPIFQRPRRIGVQDGTPPDSTTIGPGDPAFVQCLRDYLSGVNNSAPISTGAFVDLGWAIDPNWTLFNANDSIEAHLLFPPHEANPPGTKPNLPDPQFHRAGNPLSALWGVPSDQSVADPDPDLRARVYDTGSSHYEKDGVAQGPILVQPRHWPAQYYDWRVNSWLNPVKPVQVPSGDERGPDAATDGLDNSNVNTQLVAVGGIDDPSEREAPPPYDAEVKAIQIKIRVFEPDSRQVREVTVVQEMISQ